MVVLIDIDNNFEYFELIRERLAELGYIFNGKATHFESYVHNYKYVELGTSMTLDNYKPSSNSRLYFTNIVEKNVDYVFLNIASLYSKDIKFILKRTNEKVNS